jgi:hypothetical protein
VVAGAKAPSSSSIVVRRGSNERCEIASLGVDHFAPEEEILTSQVIVFKGCTVTIPIDHVTGKPGTASISGDNCVFLANGLPIGHGELKINGISVGNLTRGDGFISSGTSSCTTKVISDLLYTWCTCADTDGDNIPNDPIPPCPASL